MKRLIVAGIFLAVSVFAGPIMGEQKPPAGIGFVVRFDCDGQCAEPFFTPQFRFVVKQGTWPAKGKVITGCQPSGRTLKCADGLTLEISGVIFK